MPVPQFLNRISRRIARIESALAVLLMLLIALLLLGGTIARSLGRPLIRSDEAAVLLMVWIAFIGASLGIREGSHMAIGLLPDRLGEAGRIRVRRAAMLLTGLFLVAFAVMLWRWFDLPGLIRAGGGQALARETFNYIYTEPTQTLGLPKFLFWLVMPFSTACALLHLAAGWK